MKDSIYHLLTGALRFWDKCAKNIWTLLINSPEEFNKSVWEVMCSINDAVKYIAYGLLIVYFGMGIIKETTNSLELKKPETWIRLIIKFIVAKALITYSIYILNTIFSVVAGVIGQINSTITGVDTGFGGRGGGVPEEIHNYIYDLSFWNQILGMIIVVIGYVVIIVLSITAVMTVYSRFFKIYIYTALAPIPLASFANNSAHDSGTRFLKAYAAVCLEGAVIALACVIFNLLVSNATQDFFFSLNISGAITHIAMYLVQVIFNMLLMIGIIKGASGIVHEMISV